MNRSRLLLIGFVALALGAIVAFLVYRRLQTGVASAPAGVDVMVAADDLEVGARIGDRDVKFVRMPASDLPANVFHPSQKSKVIGRGVISPIFKGEFVLTNKLAGENAGSGLPALIPPGMRAVSVRVNDTTSVAGFVVPGTRVDVLLTGSPQGSTEPQTSTVLENVAVIATGQKLDRLTSGDAQPSSVITLLVSPDDAEKLALANSQGHIQLALRNPLDTNQTQIAAVRANGIYGNAAPISAPVHARLKASVAPNTIPVTAYTVEVYRGEKKEETKF